MHAGNLSELNARELCTETGMNPWYSTNPKTHSEEKPGRPAHLVSVLPAPFHPFTASNLLLERCNTKCLHHCLGRLWLYLHFLKNRGMAVHGWLMGAAYMEENPLNNHRLDVENPCKEIGIKVPFPQLVSLPDFWSINIMVKTSKFLWKTTEFWTLPNIILVPPLVAFQVQNGSLRQRPSP